MNSAAFDADLKQTRNILETVTKFGCNTISWYFAHGWTHPVIFQRALRLEFDVYAPLSKIESVYIRIVPSGTLGWVNFIRSKSGRGAFPVMLYDVERADEQRQSS